MDAVVAATVTAVTKSTQFKQVTFYYKMHPIEIYITHKIPIIALFVWLLPFFFIQNKKRDIIIFLTILETICVCMRLCGPCYVLL